MIILHAICTYAEQIRTQMNDLNLTLFIEIKYLLYQWFYISAECFSIRENINEIQDQNYAYFKSKI